MRKETLKVRWWYWERNLSTSVRERPGSGCWKDKGQNSLGSFDTFSLILLLLWGWLPYCDRKGYQFWDFWTWRNDKGMSCEVLIALPNYLTSLSLHFPTWNTRTVIFPGVIGVLMRLCNVKSKRNQAWHTLGWQSTFSILIFSHRLKIQMEFGLSSPLRISVRLNYRTTQLEELLVICCPSLIWCVKKLGPKGYKYFWRKRKSFHKSQQCDRWSIRGSEHL